MRYVLARINHEMRDRAYRIYVTESLFAQGENKRLTQRNTDLIKPKKADRRSGDEIAPDVITRLGLKVNQ